MVAAFPDYEYRSDGALLDAYGSYSAIVNPLTGAGTGRDKSQAAQVNLAPRPLQRRELDALFRQSWIVDKAVSIIPEEASKWGEWELGEESIEASAIADYQKDNRRFKPQKAFTTAGILGRLYGDGYIILGIDDGRSPDQPVDENNIRSIQFLKVLHCWQVRPTLTGDLEEPEFYELVLDGRTVLPKVEEDRPRGRIISVPGIAATRLSAIATQRRIHNSRVLRFPGKKLFGDMLQQNSGMNDSIVQRMFNDLCSYISGLSSASSMLNDYDVFTYKLKGLGKLVQEGNKDALLQRFTSIQMGMSVMKGLMMDSENEEAGFVNRNLGGINSILDMFMPVVAGAAGVPYSFLFEVPAGGAFSESGQSDRYSLANRVNRYQTNIWRPNLMELGKYILLSKDGPTQGQMPKTSYGFKFHNTLQLTLKEEAQLRKQNSGTDKEYMGMGVLTPMEIRRSRFGSAEYGNSITLDDGIEKLLEARQMAALNPQPEAIEGEIVSRDSDGEFREDADTYVPPQGVRDAAQRGLDLRREFSRGGTEVGIARARDLARGAAVSRDTIVRMVSFFARHEVDKQGANWGDRSNPSNGYIAWQLWGGDPGKAWADKIWRGIQNRNDSADYREDFSYVKRILKYKGMEIGLEYAPGDRRFNRKLPYGYGHIRKHLGADREALDVYLAPAFIKSLDEGVEPASDRYFRVTQLAEDGDFDEHKYFFGFDSLTEVEAAYKRIMPERFFGGVERVRMEAIASYRVDAEPKFKVGDRVSWEWSGSTAFGTVKAVYTKRVKRTINSSTITRNGTEENPAIEVAQANSARALKLASELRRAPNLDQMRVDASLGLIPRAEYLAAAGYDVKAVEQGLRDEFEADVQPKQLSLLEAEL